MASGSSLQGPSKSVHSLSGTWRFRLDPEGRGVAEEWFSLELDDEIELPGTTDESRMGELVDERCEDRLSRIWRWIGPAWYQRRVTVPPAWRDKHVELFLERTKHTQVWVDGVWIGAEDSLSAPHVHDLSEAMSPGEHTLTILVDNAKLPPVGPAHAVDERTQTNWNGIVGRIELEVREKVWIEDVRAFTDLATRTLEVRTVIRNATPWQGHCDLTIGAESVGGEDGIRFEPVVRVERLHGPSTQSRVKLAIPDGAPLWDEFCPAQVRLTVSLTLQPSTRVTEDSRSMLVGLREFKTHRAQFTINGRPTFLRGKNDACIFPLTGYPPMDKAGWLRVLGISKSYGINHYRFHSWCPPEAAFAAADELGMYLQPELPNKMPITRPEAAPYETPPAAFETLDEIDRRALTAAERTGYLRREGEKILRAFGNHPSFVMMTLGNEIGGDPAVMKGLCDHFRSLDPRHLYAMGTNHFHWEPACREGDEFWVIALTGTDRPVRGAYFHGQYLGHVDHRPPSTLVDYARSIAGVPVPVVGHEVGQYQVSPDFREIPRYTGVLRARNLEIFRQRLDAAGMLDQADDFLRASGALAAICCREEIEAALRTPGFGGFQLLDLQDFPGQGTALVGILNAFMESKGLIDPEGWREFCCETVPLLGMGRYTWTTDESFVGRIRVAHYGPADLEEAVVSWQLADSRCTTVAEGHCAPTTIVQGRVSEVDLLAAPLARVDAPQKLTLTLAIQGTPYRNRYPVWVYPPAASTDAPDGVVVSRRLDPSTRDALARGGRVLLLPELDALPQSIQGAFQCDFWCWPMFRRAALRAGIEPAPGTLGILCDPGHPALAGFPTESHSNWQWWHLVKNSRAVVLDAAPRAWRPIVQAIDNFARNHKLGLLFETRLGPGRLLVCTIDLPGLQDKPEARQLLASLLAYAGSDGFAPDAEIQPEILDARLPAT